MIAARYLFRMDDITPTMHWGRFWSTLNLLRRYKVRPLLGVVPDNRDHTLNREKPRSDFWTVLKQLRDEGIVEISQHGYQHILKPRPGLPIIGRRHGIKEVSEFAGDTYGVQLTSIEAGARILESHGLRTPFFMAPNHSFDRNTLRALSTCGFSALSDGVALFPFSYEGVVFIPQQLWRPRPLPCGVITICLHSNDLDVWGIKRLREFVRLPRQHSTFSQEVSTYSSSKLRRLANGAFHLSVCSARALKGLPPRSVAQEQPDAHQERAPRSWRSQPLPSHQGSSPRPISISEPGSSPVSSPASPLDASFGGQGVESVHG